MIRGDWASRRVWINDLELSPKRSQKLWNYSPDGFDWGYGGSGPAQLALALMLEFCELEKERQNFYQNFKFQVIAGLPQGDFELDEEKVRSWINNQRAKENDMGLDDFLKGMKPEENESGFEPLDGIFKMTAKALTVNEPNQYVEYPHYKLELVVAAVLDGKGSVNRTLRRNYNKTKEEEVRKLVNDLFTAGIDLDRANGLGGFEASFLAVEGKTFFVRAWGWTPDKDRNGQPISDGDRRTIQQFVIMAEKRMEKTLAKRQETTPF